MLVTNDNEIHTCCIGAREWDLLRFWISLCRITATSRNAASGSEMSWSLSSYVLLPQSNAIDDDDQDPCSDLLTLSLRRS